MKEKEEKKNKEKNTKVSSIKWFFTVFILTFVLSSIFSYISTNGINNLNVGPAIVILIVVILVGVLE